MRTLFEHDVKLERAAEEVVEHRIYSIHLDPQAWTARLEGLQRLETELLLKLPLPGTWSADSKGERRVHESYVLDDESESIRRARAKRGISLKIEKGGGDKKLQLTLKVKSLDQQLVKGFPLVTDPLHAGVALVRSDQTFGPIATHYSRSCKVSIKAANVPERFSDVYALFPELERELQIPPSAAIVKNRRRYQWKATFRSTAQIHARVALDYGSRDAAKTGEAVYGASFQLRVITPSVRDARWLDLLRAVYSAFYGHMVTSPFNYTGPLLKAPIASGPSATREYALFLQASKFADRAAGVAKLEEFLQSADAFAGKADFRNARERYLEHFSLDTAALFLKSQAMSETVLKLERNVQLGTATITCKHKGFDADVVRAFPVRVAAKYPSSAKLETDFHPLFARVALSLVATIRHDTRITSWRDLEEIFPGLLAFVGVTADQPVVVRLYKVKYEKRQEIAIGAFTASGRISLEYASVEDAMAGVGMFHGEYTFRLREPQDLQSVEAQRNWTHACQLAYQLYFDKLVKCPWNYEGAHTKPDAARPVPQLADGALPTQRTCGIVVLRRGAGVPAGWEVLLLCRSEDKSKRSRFDLPKGRQEPNEAELDTALRELHEETGLARTAITVSPNLRYVATRYPLIDGKTVRREFVLFLAQLVSDGHIIRVSAEHAGFVWRAFDATSRLDLESADPLIETCLLQLQGHLPALF